MKTEAVITHIVNWLKTYAQNAKINGFVIGISGGIDSAVTSSLCAKTGLPLLCLEMPIHQNPNQVTLAQNHIAWLTKNYTNVNTLTTDLTGVFDKFVEAVPQVTTEEDRMMALANTRARLRMTTLYYFAGLNGYLVAGTGNKVEDFGVGFYTKYGDGGVDLSPIADLTKSEVYALAKTMGIDPEIQKAAPTDGLWGDNRNDEDQIGANYPELEWAMEMSEKGKKSTDFEGRQREVYEIYTRLHRANQHKMVPIPVCIIPENLK